MRQATIKKDKRYKFGISLAKGTTVWVRQDGDRFLAATEKDATIWMGVFKKDFEYIPEKPSKVILQPAEITAQYANHSGVALIEIQKYSYEVGIVSIILSDNYMKELYTACDIGYIACIDILAGWAVKFVNTFCKVEEWEEFCSTQTFYKNIMCWDDFVIAFGREQLDNHLK